MKKLVKFSLFLLPSALIFHIALIFIRGYFLSGEFTLYPYLISQGFLPYRDIIDQHFPTLLFGPFSLLVFLTANPWPLLGLFLTTLCLTDILLYASLIRFKIKLPFVWLVLFIVSSVYFSGYVLWIETFVNLLISMWLFLSFSKNNLHLFVSGFLLSQIVLLRPTIVPALLILFFSLSGLSWSLIFGGIFGLGIPALFVIKQGILSDFYRLVIQFNKEVYPHEATLFPGKRQIIILLAWLTPTIYSVLKNKKYQFLAVILLLLPLAYPRFGFEHLQPLFLLSVLFWAKTANNPKLFVYLFIIGLFCLNLISGIRHPYGNYYLTKEVREAVIEIKKIPSREIYFLGVPDILYPLSGKTPPNYTYVPSLPWYLHQQDFQDKIIYSLAKDKVPVIINAQAEVDGKNIIVESQKVFEYIKMNYNPGEKIGNYQLFIPKL
ncbi:MAG TPA: hypothetical protein PLI45_01720 [Candidatus Woesebacteria bacterium]|nr:hypothetical protein [Candidatus Woesebacteria bacterium]